MTARRPLTRRQRRLLDFIASHTAEHGWAPTIREMCTAVDVKSTSTVFAALTVLEARGHIRRHPGHARALAVVEPVSS